MGTLACEPFEWSCVVCVKSVCFVKFESMPGADEVHVMLSAPELDVVLDVDVNYVDFDVEVMVVAMALVVLICKLGVVFEVDKFKDSFLFEYLLVFSCVE